MTLNDLAGCPPLRERCDAGARPLAGRPAWLISDGTAGMEVQVAGVAQALGVAAQRLQVCPRLAWRAMAPWGPADPKGWPRSPAGPLAAPWPAVALASGRQSIPYLRAIRRRAGGRTFTVVIQDPRTGRQTADLICVPEHDGLSGDNVFATLTAPHGFTPDCLAALRQTPEPHLAALPSPRVTVALGGPNAVYAFGTSTAARLARALASLKALGTSFLVTPSRRTPPALVATVAQATQGAPRLIWDGRGDNPYPSFLALADLLIVTADSVNMTGEACATGRPVYVFEPDGGSDKFRRFHASLRRYGATRPLPEVVDRLESWSYPPLDSAAEIAREIERRWQARQTTVGAERDRRA